MDPDKCGGAIAIAKSRTKAKLPRVLPMPARMQPATVGFPKSTEDLMATLPSRGISRAEMTKRVAYFKDLQGFDGGLPDSRMAGSIRKLE